MNTSIRRWAAASLAGLASLSSVHAQTPPPKLELGPIGQYLLIGTGNGHGVLEVTPAKEIVWRIDQQDLPGITLAWVTQVRRLANGNTQLINCHAGPENPQIIEVTPAKQVVWTFKDFETFGDSLPVAVVLDP